MFNRLPPELWMDILSLLPVKPLLVLGAVCKSFLSITHDSHFVSLHLRRFPSNTLETRFLTLKHGPNGVLCEVRDTSNSFAPIATVPYINEPGLQTGERVLWCLSGSLDGLHLILSIHHLDHAPRTAVLWNPSIRKLRQISLPSPEVKNLYLGYHSLSKDYKVVATSVSRDEAWLFSVKTGSWSELMNSGFSCKFGKRPIMCTHSFSFNNGVLWIETCFISGYDRLVLFDFGSERFRYTDKMPYSIDKAKSKRSGCMMAILDGGSSVGVVVVDPLEQGSILALETHTMSWTRRYKIPKDVMPNLMSNLPYYAGLGRVRIIEKSGELVWKCWTRNSVEVLSYYIEEQVIKDYQRFSEKVEDCLGVYFESLVML